MLIYQVNCLAQQYPDDYFASPLEIPIALAGTFGELRNNHFHAGLDIKTQGKTGLNVLAAADGFVSRIKVALWGYGKVLYVTHPNGYTSVYAHLSKFNDEIDAYVKNIQYQKESYETGNIFLKPGQLEVKKGQVIAKSGRTGGFVAPHLHYEIRDTKTAKIINPMFFGLAPKDTKPPTISSIIAYPLDDNSRINNSNTKTILEIKRTDNNNYSTAKITASGTIGFGVNVYDQLNNSLNHNGIFSLEMQVNGKRFYYHDVETFSFAESKYINLLIDYSYYKKYKRRYQKTHKSPENKLSIYDNLHQNGFITVTNNLNYTVKIIAKDFIGNSSSISIPIVGKPSNAIFTKRKDSTAFKIDRTLFNKFTKEKVTVAFPKNTFYEDFYLDFNVEDNLATVHQPMLPLNKNYTLTFDVTEYTEAEKKQLYIANVNQQKYPSYQNTRKKDSIFYTTTKTLGKYTLLSDNQKPKIYKLDFYEGQWLSNYTTITVKIEDSQSGIDSFVATIDDEWILMEYDLRNKKLTYNFSDKKLDGNKHIFKLVVSDNVGNTNSISRTFYRKQ